MMYVRKDSLKAKPSFFYHGSKVCSLSIYFDDVCEEGFAQSEAFLFFIMDPKSVHYPFTSMMYVRKDSLKAKPSFFIKDQMSFQYQYNLMVDARKDSLKAKPSFFIMYRTVKLYFEYFSCLHVYIFRWFCYSYVQVVLVCISSRFRILINA